MPPYSFRPLLFFFTLGVAQAALPAPAASANPQSVRARFVHADQVGTTWQLAVADTLATQSMGLMYRHRLPAKAGMLFVFGEAAPRSFWMKNTYVSLDMIFVDEQCKVVHVIAHAPPQSCADQSCPHPSRYVVELLAGSAERDGIVAGSQLQILSGARGIAPACAHR